MNVIGRVLNCKIEQRPPIHQISPHPSVLDVGVRVFVYADKPLRQHFYYRSKRCLVELLSSVGVDYFVVSRTMRRNARFRNRQYVLKLNSCRNTQTFAAAAADGVIAAAFDLATDCKANTVRDEPPPLNSTAPSDVSQSGDQV